MFETIVKDLNPKRDRTHVRKSVQEVITVKSKTVKLSRATADTFLFYYNCTVGHAVFST